MTTTPIPLLLDCDTGIDDALALAYLVGTPSVRLVGITTVSGNTSSEQAAVNTLALLDLVGRTDIPVAVGAHDPLIGTFHGGAPHVHGRNGIGDVPLDAPATDPVGETGPELLVRLAREHGGELHVLAVGPLTNLARALELEPRLPELVARLTVMGGAVWVPGNITPHGEANIHNDADAADRVLAAGWRDLTLVPLDVTLQHCFTDDDARTLAGTGSALDAALGTMLTFYIGFYESVLEGRRAALHDPLAAAIAAGDISPGTVRDTGLAVVLDDGERGRTVPADGRPVVHVVTALHDDAAPTILTGVLAASALVGQG